VGHNMFFHILLLNLYLQYKYQHDYKKTCTVEKGNFKLEKLKSKLPLSMPWRHIEIVKL